MIIIISENAKIRAGIRNCVRGAGFFCAAASPSEAHEVCSRMKANIAVVTIEGEADGSGESKTDRNVSGRLFGMNNRLSRSSTSGRIFGINNRLSQSSTSGRIFDIDNQPSQSAAGCTPLPSPKEIAEEICGRIKQTSPSTAIICLLGGGIFDSTRYLTITGSDYQLNEPYEPFELQRMITQVYQFRFGSPPSDIRAGALFIDRIRGEAILAGYGLPLTKSEFAILRYLAYCYPESRKPADIIAVCLSPEISEGNVATHICMINKKSKEFFGRNIVKNSKKKGYYFY